MNKTSIEWVKNPDGTQGFTWNPITGCLNHTPEGLCLGGMFPCYAYRLANGRLRSRYLANMNCPTSVDFRNGQYKPDANAYLDPFYPRYWPYRVLEPWDLHRKHKAKGIFVCDMGELFGDWIPEEWQQNIFTVMKHNNQHRFYLLTKQPQNLAKFSPFPDNCWVGVTATSEEMFVNACLELENIDAKVKYISLEPLLQWQTGFIKRGIEYWLKYINWLIIGAQTKPYKPPEIEWVEEIVKAAGQAGIPVFLKDNLRPLIRDALWPQWSMDERGDLRQEMPGLERIK